MAVEPEADALGEGKVVEEAGELADGAVGDGNGVDEALVAHFFGAEEAHVERAGLDVLEPGVVEEIATLDAEGYGLVWASGGLGGGGEDGGAEVGGDALVGVEVEDPGVAEGDVLESPVLVVGPVGEGAGRDAGAGGLGDLGGGVGGEGVEDVDVVGPGDGSEAGGEVDGFVAGEDEDGDHWGYGIGFVVGDSGEQATRIKGIKAG